MTNNGCDVVYACSAEALNEKLRTPEYYFSISGEFSDSSLGIKLCLKVNNWQICSGGNANILKMEVSVECDFKAPVAKLLKITSAIKIPLIFLADDGSSFIDSVIDISE